MSTFFYLFRELLGSIRARSAVLFFVSSLSVFVCVASFAALLLIEGAEAERTGEQLGSDEIIADLSPRLSAGTVDDLHLRILQREDVASVSFRFAEEVSSTSTGGRFFIRAVSAEAMPTVLSAVDSMDGITQVRGGDPIPPPQGLALPDLARIALLVCLVVCVVLSLVLSRAGYRALLGTFHGEIRIMRLSGTPERTIVLPIVGLGILMGLLAGLLLVVGIYLGQYALGESAATVSGLADVGRVLGVTLSGLILSLLLGSLVGLLGASLLSSREFSPLR